MTARVVVCALGLAATAVAAQAPSAIAEADEAMRLGRFDRAAAQYEAWLAIHPDAHDVLLALGASYIQLGRTRDAVAVLERYVAVVPDSADGHAALGIALLDVASMPDARRALERALAINPHQINAREALARVHLVEGRPAAAAALLATIIDEKPAGVTEGTKQLYAESLIQAGDPATAARLLDVEIAANPQRPIQTYALACLAHIRASSIEADARNEPASDGRYDRASAVCEQGMRLHPDSEIEGVYLSLPPAVLAGRTATRLASLRQPPDVRELIALGRVLTDVDPTRQTRAAEIARQLLADAVAAAPDDSSARYNYGRALRRSDLRGALAQWGQALTLGPADDLRMQILTQIARAKDDSNDDTGAEAAFREALALNRRLPRRVAESALDYVRFLQRHARPVESAALVDEVVGWNPWAPEARIEKARLLADAGRWPEVVVEGEFVLANTGGKRSLQRAAHALLARAYYRMQQQDKALAHRTWLEANQ